VELLDNGCRNIEQSVSDCTTIGRNVVHGSMYIDKAIIQSCSVYVYIYIYIYIRTVMNTSILQLVAVCKIQLHVSALYVGHHQVVQRTY